MKRKKIRVEIDWGKIWNEYSRVTAIFNRYMKARISNPEKKLIEDLVEIEIMKQEDEQTK